MNSVRTKTEIQASLDEVQREIIGLEEAIKHQRPDSGSDTLDDSGQESVAERQNLDLLASQLDQKRQQMLTLQEELLRAV